MFARSFTRPLVLLGAVLAIAACSGTATNPPTQNGGGGAASAGPSVAGSTGSSVAAGTDGFEGTLTSSGIYAATWTVAPGSQPNPFNASNKPELTSDKNTFGYIGVATDGSVSFGSGATELSKNGAYKGTGAKVTLDSSGQFVCAFTIDTDLKGTTDNAVLHLAGSMTVHWHLVGVGGPPTCP